MVIIFLVSSLGRMKTLQTRIIFCEILHDATAIAEILGATSFNYISDSVASGGTSSDEQFTPTPANGVSSGASSKTKLKGSNLHFGYAFENFRLTFSDFSWIILQVGTSALRCFLPIGCYLGVFMRGLELQQIA